MNIRQRVVGIAWGLLSGPLLATAICFLPFGLLTIVFALFDPGLGVYRSTPLAVLLSPWWLLALLISVANIRIALLDIPTASQFSLVTRRFVDDDSGTENINGNPGKMLAGALLAHIRDHADLPLQFSEVIAEDYGWGFWVSEANDSSPLWVAISYGGKDEDDISDVYHLSVNVEPPILPWKRLRFRLDRRVYQALDRAIHSYLDTQGIEAHLL